MALDVAPNRVVDWLLFVVVEPKNPGAVVAGLPKLEKDVEEVLIEFGFTRYRHRYYSFDMCLRSSWRITQ